MSRLLAPTGQSVVQYQITSPPPRPPPLPPLSPHPCICFQSLFAFELLFEGLTPDWHKANDSGTHASKSRDKLGGGRAGLARGHRDDGNDWRASGGEHRRAHANRHTLSTRTTHHPVVQPFHCCSREMLVTCLLFREASPLRTTATSARLAYGYSITIWSQCEARV